MEPPREDASDPPPSDVDTRSVGSRSRRDDASVYSADSSSSARSHRSFSSARSHCSAGSRRRSHGSGAAAEPAPRRTDAPDPDANRSSARSDGDWYCDEMRDLHRDSDLETLGGYADGRHKIRFAEQVFRPPPSSTEEGRTKKSRRGGRAAASSFADSASSESSASTSTPSIRASSSHYSPPNVTVKVFARQRGFVKKNVALLALSAVLVVAMLVGNVAETDAETEAAEGGAASARAQRRLVDARGGARAAPASGGVWGKVPAFLRGLFSSEAVGPDEGFAAEEERQEDLRDRGTGGTGVEGGDYEGGTPEADPNLPAFPAVNLEKVRTPQDQTERHLRKGVEGGGADGGVPLVDPEEFRRQQEELEGKGADVAEGGGADHVEELGDGGMGHYDQQAPPDQLAQMMHQVQMEREQQGLPVAQPAPMEQQVPTEQQAQMDQQAQAEQQAQIAQQAQVIAQLTPEEQRAQVEALEQQAAALRQQTADVRQLYSNVVHTLKNSA